MESLTELVLDRNKIKVGWLDDDIIHFVENTFLQSLHESSFNSLYNLRELHLEENRLKELSHLSTSLSHLERLYLGMNRLQVPPCSLSILSLTLLLLQEFSELEKLSGLTELMELSIVSNPVSWSCVN